MFINVNKDWRSGRLHYVDFRYREGDSASQAVVGLGPRDEALATLDLTRLDELRMLGRLKEYGQALTEAFFAAVRLRSRGALSALAAIAAPAGLEKFQLAPVDKAAELVAVPGGPLAATQAARALMQFRGSPFGGIQNGVGRFLR